MMSNAEKLATANKYLDAIVQDCPPTATLSPDDYGRMAQTLHQDDDPVWIDACMWILAVAQARLAGGLG